jgi:hypothetical protein
LKTIDLQTASKLIEIISEEAFSCFYISFMKIKLFSKGTYEYGRNLLFREIIGSKKKPMLL